MPTSDPAALVVPAVHALTEQLETLTRETTALAERAQVLTAAIDDVRCELEWIMRRVTRNGP